MTWGEAKAFVSEYLRGDNSNAAPDIIHLKMAVMDIEIRCVPRNLVGTYTGSETDVFRVLPPFEDTDGNIVHEYLKMPDIPDTYADTDLLPIDYGLELAVIFFICSYLTNKYTDRYEAKAERMIAQYTSNEVAV